MYVCGVLKNYDDVILPLSQKQVINDLTEIDNNFKKNGRKIGNEY